MEEKFDDPKEERQPNTWHGFLTNLGEGISVICIVLAIVMLYRGCTNKESLLPSILPIQTTHGDQ